MGNSIEVGRYVTEEERQEIYRNRIKNVFSKIDWNFWKKNTLLYYYYKNLEEHRNEVCYCNKYQLNYLYKFQYYDTYELVRDTRYIGIYYKIAMTNYIYKWYSNSKC